jgi:hypothetical protein
MKNVVIHMPLWAYPVALGVAQRQWDNGPILLSCDYCTKEGKKILQGKWEIGLDWAAEFPLIACGPYTGYRIPISELEKLPKYKRTNDKRAER